MSITRIVSVLHRSDYVKPPNIVTLAAGVANSVIADQTSKGGEIAAILIQNVGNNRLYFAIGQDSCDNVNDFHGYLEAGQQNGFPTRQQVTCYSVAGTTVATILVHRKDMAAVE